MDAELLHRKLTATSLHQHQQQYPTQHSERTDNDRRHLLDESIAPSSSASQIYHADDTASGDATPRPRSPAHSILTTTTVTRGYRGFPSEAAYLAALQAFVDSKKFVTLGEADGVATQLVGFYGTKTQREIIEEQAPPPELGLGLRRKWRERKEKKEELRRRGTVGNVGGEGEGGGERGRERRGTVA